MKCARIIWVLGEFIGGAAEKGKWEIAAEGGSSAGELGR